MGSGPPEIGSLPGEPEPPGDERQLTGAMGGMPTHAEDRMLIERVAAGDREAFEALYARYYRKLFGFAQRVTRSADLVEEIVSDTLLTVWRSAARFDGRSRLSTWIFGIAYRKALQSVSRRRPLDPLPEGRASVHDPGESPYDACARHEAAALLERALRTLPFEQRAVVELTFFHGLAYGEIAGVVGCPVNTVKTRMFHARRKLREALPELGVARPSAG